MLNASTYIRRILAAALLIFGPFLTSSVATSAAQRQRCDAVADIALRNDDYPTAIALHSRVLKLNNNNALAHYHLGYAYGMAGRVGEEIEEYHRAIQLGLNKWDLFLNLGLAYYEQHEVANARSAFESAVSLGSDHAETHFNLAVVYEREGRLQDALRQIIEALVLTPGDLDAANTDAIICADLGNFASARTIWAQLIHAAPEYSPARANLATLNQLCGKDSTSCLDQRNLKLLFRR